MDSKKYCVIMAGGIGSRFWPISRNSRPKQFLDILGTGKTFLRSTFERFLPVVPQGNFLVVTNSAYKDIVLEQLPELREDQVLCEPVGRNTAPCIAYAAFRLNAVDPESEMIVTPADHFIVNEKQFVDTIEKSVQFIRQHDALMTIGIKPTNPNTGYGYIQVERAEDCMNQASKVKTFTEKPNLEFAKAFVESGEFFWNSGIFIWKTKTILSAIEQLIPETYELFDSILPYFNTADENAHITSIYPDCKSISIDFGVMEKASNVFVICSDFGWSDIGTWGSLYDHSQKDDAGNVVHGDCQLFDMKNCIVNISDDKLIVAEGLEDYIIVENENVMLICPKSNEQNIKKYIEEVKFRTGEKFI